MNTFKTTKGTELPILNLKGKDYLQVAHRLVWFREDHPTWSIQSDLIKVENNYALAKATIKNDKGDIIATAHKREDAAHFPDFIEKAETGSIGRALAYCGYGTQFCADEIQEGHRIVDAPQEPMRARTVPVQAPDWQDYSPPAPTSGTYLFKTGKFKMRGAHEVAPAELESWVSWWAKKEAQGEKLSGGLAQDIAHAKEYLANLNNTAPASQGEDEQDVPF
jgi:hypothetical protein